MNLEELGKRAIKCKRFYWRTGMALSNGRRVGDWRPGEVCGNSDTNPSYDGVVYPMLDDPATLGCMLALVQEAWSACRISLCFSAVTPNTERAWAVPVSYLTELDGIKNESFYGRTQAEALIAALEAVT